MTRNLRALVVDDSAFARKVVREVLTRAGVEVVGIARDGLEALEQVAALRPDVVTLDLVMPELDGLGVLRSLAPELRRRVVVVSVSDEESELVVEALSLGAFDFVRKPTSLATQRLYDLGGELVGKVLAAGGVPAPSPDTGAAAPPLPAPRSPPGDVSLVVLGTSTGGPQALSALVPALPGDLPVPLVVALHIPAEYTRAMAARLDRASRLRVVEGTPGLELGPGTVVLAQGGADAAVVAEGDGLVLRAAPQPWRPYHPSVDALFESAARARGRGVLGVLLTGMGDDGLAGSRAIRAAGGRILAEAEESCVVYGMPRAVVDAGVADACVPLDRVAAEIVRRVGRG